MLKKEIEERLLKLEEKVAQLEKKLLAQPVASSANPNAPQDNSLLSRSIGMVSNLIGLIRSFPADPKRDQAVGTARKILRLLRELRGDKLIPNEIKPRGPKPLQEVVEKTPQEIKKEEKPEEITVPVKEATEQEMQAKPREEGSSPPQEVKTVVTKSLPKRTKKQEKNKEEVVFVNNKLPDPGSE